MINVTPIATQTTALPIAIIKCLVCYRKIYRTCMEEHAPPCLRRPPSWGAMTQHVIEYTHSAVQLH